MSQNNNKNEDGRRRSSGEISSNPSTKGSAFQKIRQGSKDLAASVGEKMDTLANNFSNSISKNGDIFSNVRHEASAPKAQSSASVRRNSTSSAGSARKKKSEPVKEKSSTQYKYKWNPREKSFEPVDPVTGEFVNAMTPKAQLAERASAASVPEPAPVVVEKVESGFKVLPSPVVEEPPPAQTKEAEEPAPVPSAAKDALDSDPTPRAPVATATESKYVSGERTPLSSLPEDEPKPVSLLGTHIPLPDSKNVLPKSSTAKAAFHSTPTPGAVSSAYSFPEPDIQILQKKMPSDGSVAGTSEPKSPTSPKLHHFSGVVDVAVAVQAAAAGFKHRISSAGDVAGSALHAIEHKAVDAAHVAGAAIVRFEEKTEKALDRTVSSGKVFAEERDSHEIFTDTSSDIHLFDKHSFSTDGSVTPSSYSSYVVGAREIARSKPMSSLLVLFVGVIAVMVGLLAVLLHDLVHLSGGLFGGNNAANNPASYKLLNVFCDYEVKFNQPYVPTHKAFRMLAGGLDLGHFKMDEIGTHENPDFVNKGLGVPIQIFMWCYMLFGSFLLVIIYKLLAKYKPAAFKELKGGGMTQAKNVLELGKHSSLFVTFGRIGLATLFMGTGHPMGIEGPTIQIGIAFATTFGNFVRIPRGPTMTTVAFIGCVSGISGAFNTPMGAVIFAVEEFMATIQTSIITVLCWASVVACLVVRSILGNNILFNMNVSDDILKVVEWSQSDAIDVFLKSMSSYIWVEAVTVGTLCGCFFALSTRFTLWLRWSVLDWPLHWRFLILSCTAAACAAWSFSMTRQMSVYGVGNESLQDGILHDFDGWQIMSMTFAKQIAVVVCCGLGGPGGMLSPALVVGGLFGGTVGHLLEAAFGTYFSFHRCLLMGMAGGFSAMFRCPITAVILMYELTGIYSLVLPLMLCNFIASYVAIYIQPENLFHGMISMDAERAAEQAGKKPEVAIPIKEDSSGEKTTVFDNMLNTLGSFPTETIMGKMNTLASNVGELVQDDLQEHDMPETRRVFSRTANPDISTFSQQLVRPRRTSMPDAEAFVAELNKSLNFFGGTGDDDKAETVARNSMEIARKSMEIRNSMAGLPEKLYKKSKSAPGSDLPSASASRHSSRHDTPEPQNRRSRSDMSDGARRSRSGPTSPTSRRSMPALSSNSSDAGIKMPARKSMDSLRSTSKEMRKSISSSSVKFSSEPASVAVIGAPPSATPNSEKSKSADP